MELGVLWCRWTCLSYGNFPSKIKNGNFGGEKKEEYKPGLNTLLEPTCLFSKPKAFNLS